MFVVNCDLFLAQVPWTDEELAQVNRYFAKFIRVGKNVKEKDVVVIKQKYNILKDRCWDIIKKINYIIKQNEKKK